jgi:uncharacterized protein Veg
MQRQVELGKALMQHVQYPTGIRLALETENGVIRVANQKGTTTKTWPDCIVIPYIQDLMQVEVCQ